MAKTKISEFSANPANNTDIDSINIAEGCAPSGINDAIRELMAQLKDFQAGTAGDSFNGPVGTSTAAAGAFTTLTASSTATLNTLASSGATLTGGTINGMAIGGTTAAAGAFTTLAASGAVTLSGGTANGVTYLNGSKVLTSGSALTFDGTNFGVGSNAPGQKFVVNGASGVAMQLENSSDSNRGGRFVASGSAASGTFAVNTTSSGYALTFGIDSNEQMRLTSTGLGIGTSSPGYKLDVRGEGFVGTAVNSGIRMVNSGGINYIQSGNSGSAASLQFGNWYGNGFMTLDSSGNLGIGTSSPSAKLHVSATSADAAIVASNQVSTFQYFVSSGTTQGPFIGGNSNDLLFGTTGSARMRLDSSGNLGLGVTPSAWGSSERALQIGNSLSLTRGGSSEAVLAYNIFVNSAGTYLYNITANASRYEQLAGQHKWFTAPSGTAGNAISFTQAMTLDASGNLLVGTTSAISGGKVSIQYTGVAGLGFQPTSDSGAYPVAFNNAAGSGVGSISTTSTATSYNTSSDYRLKNITGPITTSGAYIDSLNPVEGTWKADGSTFVGLIAHEAQEVSRTQVATGVKDGEEMQGMSYSSSEMIANMIAELKALRARVAELEAA